MDGEMNLICCSSVRNTSILILISPQMFNDFVMIYIVLHNLDYIDKSIKKELALPIKADLGNVPK